MDVEQAFITRRQISDHDENTTRESPEVRLLPFLKNALLVKEAGEQWWKDVLQPGFAMF